MNIKSLQRELLSSLGSTSASSNCSIQEDDEPSPDALFPDCNHLHFVRRLSETNYPVYLVSCSKTKRFYAMKLFYWENDDQPSNCYTRELRFTNFTHPNVITIVDCKDEQEMFETDLDSLKVSYILMEYAYYGDFFDALVTRRIPFNETLIRTYFQQLIEGLEFLHSQGVAHLDIKLENLLIGSDYTLKLADFDMSHMSEDGRVTSRGTKNSRAPEITEGRCKNPYAADIYSAGVVLFTLKTRGRITLLDAYAFNRMKNSNPNVFWKDKCALLKEDSSFFSEEFKELFMSMTNPNPDERPTAAEIKKSDWYKMEVYTQEQIEVFMRSRF